MRWRAEGTYETIKTNLFRGRLSPGMTVVDVGANHGWFSLLAASEMGDRGRVIAIEPCPENCYWLKRSIEANGFRSIELRQHAISSHNGTAILRLATTSGGHSLRPTTWQRSGGEIRVVTSTLDDLLQELCVSHVDILKIDVEGAELLVLEGARRFLSDVRRTLLLMDVHPQYGIDPFQVAAILEKAGWTAELFRNARELLAVKVS